MVLEIFLSHIHEEKLLALKLKEELESIYGAQINIFLAENIVIGANWFNEIKKALNQADVILVLFSPYSINRPWINIEAGYGIMVDKKIIPILCFGLKNQEMPVVYSLFNSIDILDKDNVKYFLQQIAEQTIAKKILQKDIDLLVTDFISKIRPALYNRSTDDILKENEPITAWIIGSSKELNLNDSAKADEVVRILARVFAEHNIRVFMGSSVLLYQLGENIISNNDKLQKHPYHKIISQESAIIGSNRSIINPVVVLGSLRTAKGVIRTFKDSLNRVPDVAIIIGGSRNGRAYEEYCAALEANIPVLTISFTGGVARKCSNTFDASLQDEVKLLNRCKNKVDEFAKIFIRLLTDQVRITRGKSS
jgi:hypothetical protein